MEKNRVIRTDIINLEHKITWISPKIPLDMKMAHYKTHFLHISEDGFIIKPPYMDIYLSYALRSVIGQLRTSSHQLQIELQNLNKLFDTLIILYVAQIWGPSLEASNWWRSMEKPIVSTISKIIRSKSHVHHETIRAEITAPLMVVEALVNVLF